VEVGIPTVTRTEAGETESGGPGGNPESAPRGAGAYRLYINTTVAAFNADNTVHLILEITRVDAGESWSRRVDVTVPVGIKTAVAKDAAGVEYAVNVTKQPS